MPCGIDGDESIPIAEYGSSNIGRMKMFIDTALWHSYGIEPCRPLPEFILIIRYPKPWARFTSTREQSNSVWTVYG